MRALRQRLLEEGNEKVDEMAIGYKQLVTPCVKSSK